MIKFKIKLHQNAIVLFCLVAISSCSDIIVPDISKQMVKLLSPNDGAELESKTVTFTWKVIEDAYGYNLQVVSPRFDTINTVVIDTNTIRNTLTITLTDGDYEWRVIGYNDAYDSQSEKFKIKIGKDSSAYLTKQVIVLDAPINAYVTNVNPFELSWKKLKEATKYRTQIGKDSIFQNIIMDTEIDTNFLKVNFPNDGTYFWRIRGENNKTQTFTLWSSRKILIDRIAPMIPTITYPNNGDSIKISAQSPDLAWVSDFDIERDTVYIFSDSSANNLIAKYPSAIRSFNLDGSVIDMPNTARKQYFWRVLSIDKAGNNSANSVIKSFFIKP